MIPNGSPTALRHKRKQRGSRSFIEGFRKWHDVEVDGFKKKTNYGDGGGCINILAPSHEPLSISP
jgi:hypothetical protein